MARMLIPTSIWRDPEFTGMSSSAQWLWFALKAFCEKPYRPEDYLALCPSMTRTNLLAAEAELRLTKYALAFIPRRRRPWIPIEVRTSVYERDGYQCLHCGTTQSLSLDHIHPYSLGGEDIQDNLQTLCLSCNSKKGARV